MDGENYSCFKSIPAEIILKIMDFLYFREMKKARLICHRWRFVLDSKYNRKFAFRPKVTNSSIKFFFNSYRDMDLVRFRNVTEPMTKKQMRNPKQHFPHVKNVVLGWKNSQGNIINFMTYGLEQTESLIITKFSLEKISCRVITEILPKINWNNLKELQLIVILPIYKYDRARKHAKNSIILLELAKIPILREFDFDFLYEYEHSIDIKIRFRKLFLAFYKFLVNHAHSLKGLVLKARTNRRRGFKIPEIPQDVQGLMKLNLKLESCIFKFWGIRKLESLVCPVLFGSELKIIELSTRPTDITQYIYSHDQDISIPTENINIGVIFDTNSKTLETVSLDLTVVDLTWLQNCSLLKTILVRTGTMSVPGYGIHFPFLTHVTIVIIPHPVHGYVLSPFSFQSFLLQNGKSLQKLVLGVPRLNQSNNAGNWNGDDWRWLKSCVALKSIGLYSEKDCLDGSAVTYFPYLTECHLMFVNANDQIWNWIQKSIPNTRNLDYFGQLLTINQVQFLIGLPKLKMLRFWSWTTTVTELTNYCDKTPGLNYKSGKISNPPGSYNQFIFDSIEVDRSKFIYN